MADNTTAGHVAEPAPNEVAPDSAPADQPQASAATSYAIADLHGRQAYRLLTSLVAPRPIAWISTLAADGTPNLAPFSFFNIVSGRPLMVMFSSGRRKDGEPKDTLANAAATGEFVVNLADETLAAQVNLTSATVGPNVNEFEAFGVKPAPSTDVEPPRVASAKAALEARAAQVIPIDGSTSTNDTVFLLASGASGVTPSQEELNAAVLEASEDIARQMQADAEGVTKRVTVTVEGTGSDDQAVNAARTLARDNLFKCAMFGSDPNWGRVLAAVGMADADMDPERISVYFNGQAVCENTTGTPNAREVDLSGADIDVLVNLGVDGPGRATVRTTDLSHDYVHINSAYSS